MARRKNEDVSVMCGSIRPAIVDFVASTSLVLSPRTLLLEEFFFSDRAKRSLSLFILLSSDLFTSSLPFPFRSVTLLSPLPHARLCRGVSICPSSARIQSVCFFARPSHLFLRASTAAPWPSFFGSSSVSHPISVGSAFFRSPPSPHLLRSISTCAVFCSPQAPLPEAQSPGVVFCSRAS